MKIEDIVMQKAKKEIKEDENFIESGAIDSLAFIEILQEIEVRFNKNIDFDEVEPNQIATIQGLKEYFGLE